MGATPILGLPFNDEADLVMDGSQATEDLAAAVEDALTWVVSKPAGEAVTSSIAYQNDDDLFFAVVAGGVYLVDFELLWEAANSAASGFKARWSLPAGSEVYGHSISTSADAAQNHNMVTVVGDYAGDYIIGNSPGGLGLSLANLSTVGRHKIVAGANGTARIQWAQSTSHATSTWLNIGSYLRIQRIA